MTSAGEHPAFRRMYGQDRLTLGVFMSIEAFDGDERKREQQERLARYADDRNFAALWFQDVAVRDVEFGDVGTKYDSFVYLTYMMGLTRRIALATASTVLTHRHPLRLAKEVNTLDQLSRGRFVMGISSGDRVIDFEGFGVAWDGRGERFRESFEAYRRLTEPPHPGVTSALYGTVPPGVMVPQASIPVPNIVVGMAQQSMEWIAEHADGWLNYSRPAYMQENLAQQFRTHVEQVHPGAFKPFSQPLFVNLLEDPQAQPLYVRGGFHAGREFLREYLEQLRQYGVNHVLFGLNSTEEQTRPVLEVLQEIAEEVLPYFPTLEVEV
ncbi:TIGR03571 family LLM class oxidoreductase [Tumebacillus permanentifrigoris]|uniref:Luciferase-type oxidoreductase n=1 Tax=Tumebacillus permanentifrigoris TaxID=378543 RepID=A0A316DBH0_9BACL|nr:TIGR03571 family LLM class oxidoreductase [Tumebacillus permanentifrigoris]PWK14926.1 luciferase-type oxidoreductase [Tumebacillus permanentifrigoris]